MLFGQNELSVFCAAQMIFLILMTDDNALLWSQECLTADNRYFICCCVVIPGK